MYSLSCIMDGQYFCDMASSIAEMCPVLLMNDNGDPPVRVAVLNR